MNRNSSFKVALAKLDQSLSPLFELCREMTPKTITRALRDRRIPEPVRGTALRSDNLRVLLAGMLQFPRPFFSSLKFNEPLKYQLLMAQCGAALGIAKVAPLAGKAAGLECNSKIKPLMEEYFSVTLNHIGTTLGKMLLDSAIKERKSCGAALSWPSRRNGRPPKPLLRIELYVWLQLRVAGEIESETNRLVDQLFLNAAITCTADAHGVHHQPLAKSNAIERRRRDYRRGGRYRVQAAQDRIGRPMRRLLTQILDE